MKPKQTKTEPGRTSVIESPKERRFKDSPRLAAMIARMAAALERRKCKTPWMTESVRADMLRRYADLLDDPSEATQRHFVRWAVEDSRYLGSEGNFELFCTTYLMAEPPDVAMLWGMTSEGPA